jgi:uncharacterized protein YlxW (UPF0749 family)
MPDTGPDKGPDTGPDAGSPTGTPTGRERLLAALKRPARAQVVVAVLLAVVGFSAVTQVRANEVDNTYAGLREQDLIDVLNGLAGTTQRAETEISRLEATRQSLQSSTDSRQAALAEAQDRSDTLAILAGLVPVTGPGIRITVKEMTGEVETGSMLDTLQELRTAGAEAIQVNGEVRLVAQSSLEDAVGGLLIDGELVTAPFVIDVIGEPHTLAGSLSFPRGPADQLEDDGAEIEVEELTSLDIESVVDPAQPQYAEPAPGQ